jgi:hypothetical protein
MPELLTNAGFDLVLMSLLFVSFLFYIVMRMKNKQLIHHIFAALLGCLFIWTLGALLLLRDHLIGLSVRPWTVQLAYVGLILTPVAALYVGIVFAHSTVRLSPVHLATLIVPALSLAILFTNQYHHLFYRAYDYENLTSSSAMGPYFIIHTAYSYLCISVGLIFLAYFSIKNAGFFSSQSILIIAGVLLSFGFNAAVTFQLIKAQFHATVVLMSLAFLFFYLAIFKFYGV